MGSEGRGEQILKTDQDNMLILPDEGLAAAAREAATALSAALAELGYPPCPGRMMVSNPAWTKTLDAFAGDIRLWMTMPEEGSYLNLAALFDAAPAAGDAVLVEALRREFVEQARGNSAFLANFARPIHSFDTPRVIVPQILIGITDLSRGLDLKKAAIFPIVHGARCFALEFGLERRNTLDRIDALVERNVVEARFGNDLKEAFQFALGLRLRQQLARRSAAPTAARSAAARSDPDMQNRVDLESIGRLELQLLRDALHVVIEFKRIVAHHFRLGMF
jgi:CBS domain-containing protein